MRASTSLFFLALVCAALPTFADNVATPFSAVKRDPLVRRTASSPTSLSSTGSKKATSTGAKKTSTTASNKAAAVTQSTNTTRATRKSWRTTSSKTRSTATLATATTTSIPAGTKVLDVDFGQYNAATGGVEAFLERNGLMVSTYEVGGLPQAHVFVVESKCRHCERCHATQGCRQLSLWPRPVGTGGNAGFFHPVRYFRDRGQADARQGNLFRRFHLYG